MQFKYHLPYIAKHIGIKLGTYSSSLSTSLFKMVGIMVWPLVSTQHDNQNVYIESETKGKYTSASLNDFQVFQVSAPSKVRENY
jgi:hypothetical protein